MSFREILLYWILSTSDEQCRKWGKTLFNPQVKCDFQCTDFYEKLPLQPLVKNFFTVFHENPTNIVVADTVSQTDGRTPSPHKAFFLGAFV